MVLNAQPSNWENGFYATQKQEVQHVAVLHLASAQFYAIFPLSNNE